jgi:SOS-response transcriptional repressor LexA
MFIVAPFEPPDHTVIPMSIPPTSRRYTDKQGQYLAYIHTYTKLHGRSPAEADMQSFFGTTPPSVHRMVTELERRGLIRRIPRQARSIQIIVGPDEIPPLKDQPIKSSAARY